MNSPHMVEDLQSRTSLRGSIDGRTFHTRSEIFCILNLPSAAMVANFFIHPRPFRRVSLCGVYADSSQ